MSEIPTGDWSWINEAAERFEQAWKKGTRPRIEDFLAKEPVPRQPPLLSELVRIECELRIKAGERPSAEEYRRRFPEHDDVVASVFAPAPTVTGRPRLSSPGGATTTPTSDRVSTLPPELANHMDYEIIRELGHGGMGLVFLAFNHIMGRDEVLKIISPKVIDSTDALKRFQREIRIVASLQHPNIVTAYSAFSAGESLVFAMEYVDGLDLARIVKAKGPLPVSHACSFSHQAALGLQHAHDAGLVHRDIKPGNLMLTHEEGRAVVRVLDFGLAKANIEQHAVELTPDGRTIPRDLTTSFTGADQMLGTPNFIAPEQIVNARKADIRADIYSLGCTLYNLLSGRPPFEAKLYEVLKAHRSSEAKPLNLVRPDVPEELAALVARMMAKKPGQRFQQPAEVAQALAPFFKSRSVTVRGAMWNRDSVGRLDTEQPTPSPISKPSLPFAERPPSPELVADVAAKQMEPALARESAIDLEVNFDEQRKSIPVAPTATGNRTPGLKSALAGAAVLALLSLPVLFVIGRRGRHDVPATSLAIARSASPVAVTGSAADESPPIQRPEIPPPPVQAHTPTPEVKTVVVPPAEAASATPGPGTAQKQVSAPTPRKDAFKTEKERPKVEPSLRPVSAFDEQVDHAIRGGVQFLKGMQRPDGSWSDVENEAKTGTTSLITLALLSAGEKQESPTIQRALDYLRGYGASDLKSTYAIALQTMVFAATQPDLDRLRRIANNVSWLERAQIKPDDPVKWAGSWTYSDSKRTRPGDNSNTQYALLGLHAASEAGVPVDPVVWELARAYWERSQKQDGGWAYTPGSFNPSASMTCAGVSSLIISGHWSQPVKGSESLIGEKIRDCAKSAVDSSVDRGLDWLANHFGVDENYGNGRQWRFYYLYGLERAARLAGIRFFGRNDWYRLGAADLMRQQDKPSGSWVGFLSESDKTLATSFALLFLAKGRAPVLINKLRHVRSGRASKKKAGASPDWNNDPDDVRNLVDMISQERNTLLTWQVVNSRTATVAELLRAPILFFNGHRAAEFTTAEQETLKAYVNQGGFILADACCDAPEFDSGFRTMMTAIFPEAEHKLRPLAEDHPVWRAKNQIDPDSHPLWGIQHGARTSVIYSAKDLSCYWNQAQRYPSNRAATLALQLGQNVVEFATAGK